MKPLLALLPVVLSAVCSAQAPRAAARPAVSSASLAPSAPRLAARLARSGGKALALPLPDAAPSPAPLPPVQERKLPKDSVLARVIAEVAASWEEGNTTNTSGLEVYSGQITGRGSSLFYDEIEGFGQTVVQRHFRGDHDMRLSGKLRSRSRPLHAMAVPWAAKTVTVDGFDSPPTRRNLRPVRDDISKIVGLIGSGNVAVARVTGQARSDHAGTTRPFFTSLSLFINRVTGKYAGFLSVAPHPMEFALRSNPLPKDARLSALVSEVNGRWAGTGAQALAGRFNISKEPNLARWEVTASALLRGEAAQKAYPMVKRPWAVKSGAVDGPALAEAARRLGDEGLRGREAAGDVRALVALLGDSADLDYAFSFGQFKDGERLRSLRLFLFANRKTGEHVAFVSRQGGRP